MGVCSVEYCRNIASGSIFPTQFLGVCLAVGSYCGSVTIPISSTRIGGIGLSFVSVLSDDNSTDNTTITSCRGNIGRRIIHRRIVNRCAVLGASEWGCFSSRPSLGLLEIRH